MCQTYTAAEGKIPTWGGEQDEYGSMLLCCGRKRRPHGETSQDPKQRRSTIGLYGAIRAEWMWPVPVLFGLISAMALGPSSAGPLGPWSARMAAPLQTV